MRMPPNSLTRRFLLLWRAWIGIIAGLLVLTSALPGGSKSTSSAPKTVHVRQYTRKDGTVVSAHDRAAPGTATPRPLGAQPPAAPKSASSPPAKASSAVASRVPPSGAAASPKTAPANAAKTTTSAAPASPVRTADGRIERSAAAKSAFQTSHPCPSTGARTGSCPGYIVDHVKPLACDGADAPANMQWQTVAAAKEKDKTERTGCTSSR
jgi:hypothetical protein